MANAVNVEIRMEALEISLVDHTPEEILLVTVAKVKLSLESGIGPDCDSIDLRASIHAIQIDDQLSTSRFPVLLREAPIESGSQGFSQTPLLQACIKYQPGDAGGQVNSRVLSFHTFPGAIVTTGKCDARPMHRRTFRTFRSGWHASSTWPSPRRSCGAW